jgi:hypothetical protein
VQRCEDLGISGVRDGLNQMLALDFIMANSDRHYNNFGLLRDADTLEWLGFAPIFDTGTSMWHDSIAARINPSIDQPAKPFNSRHGAQVRHITNFDWLDFDALEGVEEEYADLLTSNPNIDTTRRDALCRALGRRIMMLKQIAARREARRLARQLPM